MTKVSAIEVTERSRSVVHDGRRYVFRPRSMTVGEHDEWVRQVDEGDSQCRSVIVDIDGNPPPQYPDEVVDACVGELRSFYKGVFSGGLKDLVESIEGSLTGLGKGYKSLAGLGAASKPLALAGVGLASKPLTLTGLGLASKPLALAGVGLASKPLALAGVGVASKPLALAGLGVASKPLAGLELASKSVAGLGQELCPHAYEPGPLVALPAPEDRIVDAIHDLPDRLREEREPVVRASVRWIVDKIIPGVIVGVVMFGLGWAAREFFG